MLLGILVDNFLSLVAPWTPHFSKGSVSTKAVRLQRPSGRVGGRRMSSCSVVHRSSVISTPQHEPRVYALASSPPDGDVPPIAGEAFERHKARQLVNGCTDPR